MSSNACIIPQFIILLLKTYCVMENDKEKFFDLFKRNPKLRSALEHQDTS